MFFCVYVFIVLLNTYEIKGHEIFFTFPKKVFWDKQFCNKEISLPLMVLRYSH